MGLSNPPNAASESSTAIPVEIPTDELTETVEFLLSGRAGSGFLEFLERLPNAYPTDDNDLDLADFEDFEARQAAGFERSFDELLSHHTPSTKG